MDELPDVSAALESDSPIDESSELSVVQAAFESALNPGPHSPDGQRADPPELFAEATSLLGLPPDVLVAFIHAQRKAVAELKKADAKRVR